MADHSTRADQPTTSSPWPVLVAVGLVLSEIGVFIGISPVAIGGLVLFAASVTGFLTESDHASSPWPLAIGTGVVFVIGGLLVYAVGTGLLTFAGSNELHGLTSRGFAITAAGLVTIVGAVILRYRNN